MRKVLIFIVASLLIIPVLYGQTTLQADKSHTEIGFSVKHMVISTVRGKFKDYDLTVIKKGEDFTDADVKLVVQVKSVDTGINGRDNDLRSKNFFFAEEYPEMTFISKSMKKINDDKYIISGDLTIRGITKRIELNAEYGGSVMQRGRPKYGFHITGELDRFDYGLKYNRAIEAGGLVVSKKIKIDINLELTIPRNRNR